MMLSLTPEHQEQPVSGIALAPWATGTGHSIHDKCSVCLYVFVGGGDVSSPAKQGLFLPLHLISTDFPSGPWWHSGKRPKHPMQREGGERVHHSS